jgi:hypothetical protein
VAALLPKVTNRASTLNSERVGHDWYHMRICDARDCTEHRLEASPDASYQTVRKHDHEAAC